MQIRRSLAGMVFALATLVLGGTAQAASFTLADLVGGTGFDSDNGLLSFSNFSAILSSGLDQDLTKYTVTTLDDGFELVGPIGAADGEQDDLVLKYDVAATNAGGLIVSASLFFNGQILPAISGLSASIAEDFFVDDDLVGSMFVARTGGGLNQPSADILFAPGHSALSVEKDILVDAIVANGSSDGTIAAISIVRQRYEVVPGPATALLLGSGLGGLAILGRRRSR